MTDAVSKKHRKGTGAFYSCIFRAIFVENAGELSEYLPERIHNAVTSVAVKYQRWSMGPRGTTSRYTAVIGLDQNAFPGAVNDACRQRRIITALLPRLLDSRPSLIVIDLAFLRDSCPADEHQTWTSDLKQELIAVSDHVPVVVAQSSADLSQVSGREQRELIAQGMPFYALRLKPIIELPQASDLYVGLIRVNRDLRRVPLEWPAYEGAANSIKYVGMRPSLALQTARIVRSAFPGGLRTVDGFVANGVHPYTTLIDESEFIQTSAGDLLCGTEFVRKSCSPELLRAAHTQLRGKVALVGWVDDNSDIHPSPVGSLAGLFLQANYVESLLDGRLLHTIALRWQLLLTLVWFVLIEWPLHYWSDSLARAILVAMIMWVVVAVVTFYVLVVNAGWYLALLPPSFVAVLTRCFFQWMENKKRLSGPSEGPPALAAVMSGVEKGT